MMRAGRSTLFIIQKTPRMSSDKRLTDFSSVRLQQQQLQQQL